MEPRENEAGHEWTGPETAFAALGSEHRTQIIETLWERRSLEPGGTDTPVSFSELFGASALSDKGQFNYHLGTLVGPFLDTSEDGYALAAAGRTAALLSDFSGPIISNPDTEILCCLPSTESGRW